MPTLAEFHTAVAAELNKGSSLSSVIPNKVRQAARFLERNYSFDYMGKYQTFPMLEGTSAVELPPRLKKIEWVRTTFSNSNDEFSYFKRARGEQFTSIDTSERAVPDWYWIAGNQSLRFDAEFQEDVTLEIYYRQYTSWPVSPYTSTPDLLTIGEDLLLHQTVYMMSPYVRNPEMMQMYKTLRDEGLLTLTSEQAEAEWANTDLEMVPS